MTPTPGVQELIDRVHAVDGRVGVVSGGFHELLDPLAERLGLDFCRANRLEVVDGRLSGRVDGTIVDAAGKAAALVEWADASGIPLDGFDVLIESLGIGGKLRTHGARTCRCDDPSSRLSQGPLPRRAVEPAVPSASATF